MKKGKRKKAKKTISRKRKVRIHGRFSSGKKKTRKRKHQARKKPAVVNKKPIAKKSKTKGGDLMAKRGRKKMHGMDGRRKFARNQIIVMGAKKRRGSRRRAWLMGDSGVVGRMGNNALNVAAGVAGGIGGAFVANMIPVAPRIKAIIPILGGIVLATFTKVPALKFAGIGLGVIGGLSMVKNIMPGVPLLAGETTIVLPSPDEPRRLGDPVKIGDPVSIEDGEMMGYQTQAET